MSQEPDSPDNPKRPKPPELAHDPDRLRFHWMIHETSQAVAVAVKHDAPAVPEVRGFLLYCFLAETGLRPSETMVVEAKTDKGELAMWFVKRDDRNEWKMRADTLERQCETLKRDVRRLRAELDAATQHYEALKRKTAGQ